MLYNARMNSNRTLPHCSYDLDVRTVAVVGRLAPDTSPEPLLQRETTNPCQLRGWPEVETGKLPVQWLLPMAAMMIRPWRPGELAQATGTSLDDIARIMAAAACTGLLDASGAEPVPAQGSGNKVSGFFTRIAKRFGLNFSKGLQV